MVEDLQVATLPREATLLSSLAMDKDMDSQDKYLCQTLTACRAAIHQHQGACLLRATHRHLSLMARATPHNSLEEHTLLSLSRWVIPLLEAMEVNLHQVGITLVVILQLLGVISRPREGMVLLREADMVLHREEVMVPLVSLGREDMVNLKVEVGMVNLKVEVGMVNLKVEVGMFSLKVVTLLHHRDRAH